MVPTGVSVPGTRSSARALWRGIVPLAAACAGGTETPQPAEAPRPPAPVPAAVPAMPGYTLVTDSNVAPDDPTAVWLVRVVTRRPQMLRAVPLVYPDSLRRNGVGGDVVVEFVVDTLGRVERDIRVLESTHAGLAEPARQTVRQARFRPGVARGRPVRVLMTLRFHYEPRRS